MTYPRITITPPGIEAYDLSQHLAMIRRSKSTRGCEARLTRRAAGLWGVPANSAAINPAGVFQASRPYQWATRRAEATLEIAESPGGLRALGFSWRLPLSGATAPASVWNTRAFHTARDAWLTGLTELMSRFQHITETGIESEAAAPMLEALREALTPQLELF